MGSRTNYKIIHSENREQDINVYAHSDGEQGEEILRNAIAKAMPRLGDDSYFIRILVNALQQDHDSETGYGIYIGEELTHEEHYKIKTVNMLNNTVTVGKKVSDIDSFVNY